MAESQPSHHSAQLPSRQTRVGCVQDSVSCSVCRGGAAHRCVGFEREPQFTVPLDKGLAMVLPAVHSDNTENP